ncbi:MAG: hypothetical protein ABIF77_12460 [bacterium]
MNLLLYTSGICVIWIAVTIPLILGYLDRQGVRARYYWPGPAGPRYLIQYEELTRRQEGQVGRLFYHYTIPLRIAFLISITLGCLVCLD